MKILMYLFFIIFIVPITFQAGWADSVKIKEVKLTEEFVIGDTDIDEQLLQYPAGIKLYEGNIYILDSKGCSIKKYDKDGHFQLTFGMKGTGPQELMNPRGFTISNKKIYISNSGNSRIEIFDLNGVHQGSFKLNRPPKRICSDNRGNLLINFDENNFLVHKYNEKWELIKSFLPASDNKDPMVGMFNNMIHMTVTEKDELVVAYQFMNKIEKYNSEGTLVWSTKRPIAFDYEPLTSVTTKTSTRMSASSLSRYVTCENNIIYIVTSQGRKKEDRTDTLCDRIDSKGNYMDSFKIPFYSVSFQVVEQEDIYIINAHESTVHKFKILGLKQR